MSPEYCPGQRAHHVHADTGRLLQCDDCEQEIADDDEPDLPLDDLQYAYESEIREDRLT